MITVVACRARAVENEAQAESAELPRLRQVFQESAKAWRQRADMLERLDKLAAARRVKATED